VAQSVGPEFKHQYSKKKKKKKKLSYKARNMAQEEEHLPSRHKALSSNPSISHTHEYFFKSVIAYNNKADYEWLNWAMLHLGGRGRRMVSLSLAWAT
jgi:hypothetical protein